MYVDPQKKIKLALGVDPNGEKFKLDVSISNYLIPSAEDPKC
jgi:hypothetical protein